MGILELIQTRRAVILNEITGARKAITELEKELAELAITERVLAGINLHGADRFVPDDRRRRAVTMFRHGATATDVTCKLGIGYAAALRLRREMMESENE